MDITNVIINISISVTAGAVAGFGIFRWLGQSWIKNWFAKDLENHKSELEAKNKEVQNRLDTKLALLQIKETQVYEKRLDAIKEVHIHLSNIYNSVKGLRVIKDLPFSSIDENTNKAIAEEIQAFYKIWPTHKLYFNRDLAKKIEKSVELCFKAVSAILLAKNESVAKQIECHLNVNITDYIGEQDLKILDGVIMDIEKEFRSILGIEN